MSELCEGVQLVAAAKTRSPEEVLEAVNAGVQIIGENYVQEAERAYRLLGSRAKWHFIGHLQRNKVKKTVRIFDIIETMDSMDIAREIDRRCAEIGKVMPVLIEVNIGREEQKSGVLPEMVESLVREVADLPNISVQGLMAMGPRTGDPEESRAYFVEMRRLFESLRSLNLPGVDIKYLSMGMTNTYRIAIEEGANIVRIGTGIFGEREGE